MSARHPADQDLVSRDRHIPGLCNIFEPERFLGTIRQTWPDETIETIRLDYVRYKPGVNCIGRYTLGNGACEWTGYAKVFGRDGALKLEKARSRSGDPAGPPTNLAVENEALLFFRFPGDLKLRSIRRLAERATRRRLVRRVFKDDDNWLDARYRVLNYKPERRLVCQFENAAGLAATVKFYTADAYARTIHLRRNRAFPEHLPVPRYIGGSRKHCVHAFAWQPGRNLRDLSLEKEQDRSGFEEAGRLLARIHDAPVTGLPVSDRRAAIRGIGQIAAQMALILPSAASSAERLADRLGRAASEIQRDDGPVHGDFYDKQVILGPQGAVLLDLDRSRTGTPAEDLGCFTAHLELLDMLQDHAGSDRAVPLAETLLQGYSNGGGRIMPREHAIWTAVSLFGLCHHPFRDRSPEWPDRTHEILSRAEALLAKAERYRGGAAS